MTFFKSEIRVLAVLVSALILSSCASGGVSAENGVRSQRYVESGRAAAEAFGELDDEIAGRGRPVEETRAEPKPRLPVKEAPSVPEKPEQTAEKPSPARTADKPRPGTGTVYPIVNGYPVWVMDPYIEGYAYTAVGSAKSQSGGAASQKRAARSQAMGELSRMIKIRVDNEIASSATADGRGNFRSDVKTYSRQRSEGLLNSVEELDRWTNPENGDYYLLLGIKGE